MPARGGAPGWPGPPKRLSRREDLYPLLASLIRTEVTHRQSRSINYRIGGANFPVLKGLEDFVFSNTPIDESLMRELAGGDFVGTNLRRELTP